MQRKQGILVTSLALVLVLITRVATAQTTHTITVGDNFFSPENVTIQVGDTVRWVNAAGGNPHNVTSPTGAFDPSPTASSFEFEVTFNEAGLFAYRCTIHPVQMTGIITVEGDGGAAAALRLVSVAVQDRPIEPLKLMNIETRVRNTGNTATGDYSIDFYLSGDASIEATDTALGSAQGVVVQPGETVTQVTNIQVPEIEPGTYFIGAIVDFDDDNLANNVNLDPEPLVYALFFINAGLNDAWFNPATNGQGFFIIVFEDIPLVFLAWFTYDTERPPEDVEAILGDAGHRWITAQGGFEGDTAELAVVITRGGVFDSGEPAPENEFDGSMTVTFESCTAGTVAYNIPSLGLMGEVPIQRIANDNVPLCEELNGNGP